VAILSAIILGIMRDNTSPITNLTTDGDSCDDAFVPITRAELTISESTSNVAMVDIEAPSCGAASVPAVPGVWYNFTSDDGNITLSEDELCFFISPLLEEVGWIKRDF
jgi:hypothetical protein